MDQYIVRAILQASFLNRVMTYNRVGPKENGSWAVLDSHGWFEYVK